MDKENPDEFINKDELSAALKSLEANKSFRETVHPSKTTTTAICQPTQVKKEEM